LDLTLVDLKGPILQGQDGFSQKGPDPGNASYYYSLTRLQSDGSVAINENRFKVSGAGWMDHEFSTSALNPDQIGWDWFSIQLDNDDEIMFFQIRQADGSIDPFSSGKIIYVDGSTYPLKKDDFEITVVDTWRSPRSGILYPARWKVNLPSQNLILELIPYLDDQEMNVSYIYWEGAVQVRATLNNQEIAGSGYVEMTGYMPPTNDPK
jgi:predicted secreted hydrolase